MNFWALTENFLSNFIKEIWSLTLEMSPYLLIGLLMAGILRLFLPNELLKRHLEKRSIWSIIKASLIGVPIPICSCGVIPVAAHLKKEGASKSSVLSFLTSTPTTGIDSILATYALMGPIFAILRPILSFISGIIVGLGSLFIEKNDLTHKTGQEKPPQEEKGLVKKFYNVFHYAFVELIEDIGKWLILGIIFGGLITALIPANLGHQYLSNPLVSYPLMFIVGIPLYVCSTGSIPMAASMIKVGLTPGAALVFLLAGPATNTATIAFVGGKLGKKTLTIYLISIIFVALFSGIFLDISWKVLNLNQSMVVTPMKMIPYWYKLLCSIALVLLICYTYGKKLFKKKYQITEGAIYSIPEMSCANCEKTIETIIKENFPEAVFTINRGKKIVRFATKIDVNMIKEPLESKGYSLIEKAK